MELTYLDDVLAHQGSLICLLLAVPAAVTDAIMRSLCGRTVPGGAVGILPAFMMVVAGCHCVEFC